MSVIDASVYVAINKESEPNHKVSIQWMVSTRAMGEEIFAPNIFLAEVCASISRATGDVAESTAILRRLENSKAITCITITESLAIRAAEIGLQHKIRGCDAIYVAVAEHVGHTLVTLDNQQRKRAKAVIETATPQEFLDNLEELSNRP